MTALDLDYFRHRADEELEAAERADDPAIAHIHLEMANQYRGMLSKTGAAKEEMPNLTANWARPLLAGN